MQVDTDAVQQAYDDVRLDSSSTNWMVVKYSDDNKILIVQSTGEDYDDFLSEFGDDRAYGYIRRITGDEMSKRSKFAFIQWCPAGVPVLKRAKMPQDKASLQEVLMNFAIDLHVNEKHEMAVELIDEALRKAGGANYGTGTR